ncbi:FAM161A ciliogenesis-associated protein [Acrasis kona]|uniref:FAM161A ciliogenesis-associated protein n=1 Tax=Acrasis kona TaxID=1008807 RepID=A0AAW2ZAC7_9EUKA
MVVAPRDPNRPKEAKLRRYQTEEIRNMNITVQNELHRGPNLSDLSDSEQIDSRPQRLVTMSKSFMTTLSNDLRDSICAQNETFDEEIDTNIEVFPDEQQRTFITLDGNLDEISADEVAEKLKQIQNARQQQQQNLLESEKRFFDLRHNSRMSVHVGNTRRVTYDALEDTIDPLTESGTYQYLAWKRGGDQMTAPTIEFDGAVGNKSKVAFSEDYADGGNGEELEDDIVQHDGKLDYEHLRPTGEKFDFDEVEEIPHAWINDVSETQTSYTSSSDYMKEELKSKLDLRKKRKITIPAPFSFDHREAVKEKTISKKKFEEYISDIEAEKEAHLRTKFRANPVPLSTLEPKYEELQRKYEQNKKLIHTTYSLELLNECEPFSFVERDQNKVTKNHVEYTPPFKFKANPVPKTLKHSFSEKLDKDEKVRKDRIKVRAVDTFHNSSLPPRMQMHKNFEATRKNIKRPSSAMTFRPKINHDIPNFAELQRKFENQLSKGRKQNNVTQIQEFKFHKSRTGRSLHRILQDIEMDENYLPEKRWPYSGSRTRPRSASSTAIYEASSIPNPSTTKATNLRNETIKRQQAERDAKQASIKSQEEMLMMRSSIRVSPHVQSTSKQTNTIKSDQQQQAKMEAEATRRNRDEKLKDREYLFENNLTKAVRDRVLADVQQTLKDTGVSYLYKSISSKT